MSDTPETGSPVIQQADALMRRHRRVFVAGADQVTAPPVTPAAPAATPKAQPDLGDIPVLTDIVDEHVRLATPALQAEASEALKAQISAAVSASESELTQVLERWIDAYLPQMLSRALDGVAEQLRGEIAAKLRAEMLNRRIFDTQPAPADKPLPPV